MCFRRKKWKKALDFVSVIARLKVLDAHRAQRIRAARLSALSKENVATVEVRQKKPPQPSTTEVVSSPASGSPYSLKAFYH
jgi:hypothetical protein